jgi:hypothetical protein
MAKQENSRETDALKVGQAVHCSKDLGSCCDLKNEPLHAVVTAVHLDGTVNLCVFDREGKAHSALFVPVVREFKKGKKQKFNFCCPCDASTPDTLWDAK